MNVLVTRKKLINSEDVRLLEKSGITVFVNDLDSINTNKFNFGKIDFLVCGMEISKIDLEHFKNLKCIQLISSGYDYVNLDQLKQKNIKLCNAIGVYSIPIAEWVIGVILSKYKKLFYFHDNSKKKRWQNNYKLEELESRKVLIFGTGSIGTEIVKRLRPFVSIIDGVNTSGRKIEVFDACFTLEQARKIQSNYDILIFSLPSNGSTKGYVNYDFLINMKSKVTFVNVGRGDLVDEDDLVVFANKNNDAMFILDVVSNEPLSDDSELWGLDNVFISPHNSYASVENSNRLSNLLTSNMIRFRNNEELSNIILIK